MDSEETIVLRRGGSSRVKSRLQDGIDDVVDHEDMIENLFQDITHLGGFLGKYSLSELLCLKVKRS